MVTAWLVMGRGEPPPPPPPQPARQAIRIATPSRIFMVPSSIPPGGLLESRSRLLPIFQCRDAWRQGRIRPSAGILPLTRFSRFPIPKNLDRHGPRERTREARPSDPERLQQRLEILALG